MRRFLLFFYILVSCISFSCKKGKLKAPTASYIVVNNTIVTSSIVGLLDSHKITDIWLYVNDQFQGVYPIGSVMPIVVIGPANIRMYGGIMNNGISSTRLPYSFYNPYTFTTNFEENKTYTITPTFKYKDGLSIQSDSFNAGGSYYTSTGDSNTVVSFDPAQTWGGSGGSLFMSMSDLKPTSEIRSSTAQSLPLGGVEVYLEMDYKCNQEFSVGLICGGGVEVRPAITLRPTPIWKKIYISLTSVASTQPTYNYYNVYINAFKQSGLAHPEIYLDNIRLIKP